MAGQAIAQTLSVEDDAPWTTTHVGSAGNLVDVEVACASAFEEVQVTWFDTVAIRDLKRDSQIAAANKSIALGTVEQLITDALGHKGATKYPAHNRVNLLLALHSPLPVTQTIVDTCRASVSKMPHGYREVWLVDAPAS